MQASAKYILCFIGLFLIGGGGGGKGGRGIEKLYSTTSSNVTPLPVLP